jgi:enamine deaminase RidA (YjgF/YER057c/UK114 family)
MSDQTRAVMARVDKILQEGNSSKQSMLSATLCVTGPSMEKKPAIKAARGDFYPVGCEPARATIAIEAMGALRLIESNRAAAVDDGTKLGERALRGVCVNGEEACFLLFVRNTNQFAFAQ